MSEGCGDRFLAAAVKSLKPRRRRQSSDSVRLPPPDVVPASHNYCCYPVSRSQSCKAKKKPARHDGR